MDDRIRRGAAYLDERHTGWHDDIDTDRLDLSSCEWDITGQLLGAINMSRATAYAHGFTALEPGRSERWDTLRPKYERLTEAWRDEIARRIAEEETR